MQKEVIVVQRSIDLINTTTPPPLGELHFEVSLVLLIAEMQKAELSKGKLSLKFDTKSGKPNKNNVQIRIFKTGTINITLLRRTQKTLEESMGM